MRNRSGDIVGDFAETGFRERKEKKPIPVLGIGFYTGNPLSGFNKSEDYLNTQFLAYSFASLALQSPFGFSSIFLHHPSLPTSGEQPVPNKAKETNITNAFAMLFISASSRQTIAYSTFGHEDKNNQNFPHNQ